MQVIIFFSTFIVLIFRFSTLRAFWLQITLRLPEVQISLRICPLCKVRIPEIRDRIPTLESWRI
jgi:hypothetical protein